MTSHEELAALKQRLSAAEYELGPKSAAPRCMKMR